MSEPKTTMHPLKALAWLESIMGKAGIEIVNTGVSHGDDGGWDAEVTIVLKGIEYDIMMKPAATEA